ncbi:hypothetical protein [Neobacillus sp. DY30]|uniref:hypothetical protein n=1 Tax=Neobacillus sp. DY30 TaxID=3047871 RepID=UPI0024BF32FC|nr:hypothetical protein [Neobacillus sp. DY30]WHX99792.1 hypothetical protein QNH29_25035 [Neobacillus sp. DY30]
MKKAIILLFSLSILVFATPSNDTTSQNTSVDVAKTQINKAQADPIYPPVG